MDIIFTCIPSITTYHHCRRRCSHYHYRHIPAKPIKNKCETLGLRPRCSVLSFHPRHAILWMGGWRKDVLCQSSSPLSRWAEAGPPVSACRLSGRIGPCTYIPCSLFASPLFSLSSCPTFFLGSSAPIYTPPPPPHATPNTSIKQVDNRTRKCLLKRKNERSRRRWRRSSSGGPTTAGARQSAPTRLKPSWPSAATCPSSTRPTPRARSFGTSSRAASPAARPAPPTAVWTPSWSPRWPSTSTPSMCLAGSAPRRPAAPTSPVPTWLIIPWYVSSPTPPHLFFLSFPC